MVGWGSQETLNALLDLRYINYSCGIFFRFIPLPIPQCIARNSNVILSIAIQMFVLFIANRKIVKKLLNCLRALGDFAESTRLFGLWNFLISLIICISLFVCRRKLSISNNVLTHICGFYDYHKFEFLTYLFNRFYV